MIVPLQITGENITLGNLGTFPMVTKVVTKVQADHLYGLLTDWQKCLYKMIESLQGQERVLRVYGDYLPERMRFQKIYIETTNARVLEFTYTTDVDAYFYSEYYLPKDLKDTDFKLDAYGYFKILSHKIESAILVETVEYKEIGEMQLKNMLTGGIRTHLNIQTLNHSYERFYQITDRKTGFPLFFTQSNYLGGYSDIAEIGKRAMRNTTFTDDKHFLGITPQADLFRSVHQIGNEHGRGQTRYTETIIEALNAFRLPTADVGNLEQFLRLYKEELPLPLMIGALENYKWLTGNKQKAYMGWSQTRDLGPFMDTYERYEEFSSEVALFGEEHVPFIQRVIKDSNFYGVTKQAFSTEKRVILVDLSDVKRIKKRSLAVTDGTGTNIVYRIGETNTSISLELLPVNLYSRRVTLAGNTLYLEMKKFRVDVITKLLKLEAKHGLAFKVTLSVDELLKNGSLMETLDSLKYYLAYDAELPEIDIQYLNTNMGIFITKSFIDIPTYNDGILILTEEQLNNGSIRLKRLNTVNKWRNTCDSIEKVKDQNNAVDLIYDMLLYNG